jgi:hypothetical protein
LHTHVLAIAGAVLVGLVAPGLAQAHAAAATGLAQVSPAVGRVSTPASAATSADQTALSAYHGYLADLSGDAQSSAARDTQVVDGVDSACPAALSDLNELPAAQLNQSALTDFADEVDADLDIAYMAATKPALTTFASTLTSLQWTTATQDDTATRLIQTERTLAGMTGSVICDDATTLDAAPLSEPAATAKFLTRYRRVTGNLHAAVEGFQALLSQFETKPEAKLVAQINTLVSQFSTQSGSVEATDASTVLSELGLPASGS